MISPAPWRCVSNRPPGKATCAIARKPSACRPLRYDTDGKRAGINCRGQCVTGKYTAGIAFTGAWVKGKTPDALLCRELQDSAGPRPHTPDIYLG